MSKHYSFINWHEGMYLMPEHFKENDKIQENRRKYILENFINFFYGVKKISIDENLIPEGVFRINHFEGIMPNGEILEISKNDNLDVDFKKYFEKEDEREVTLFLCIADSSVDLAIDTSKYNSIKIPKFTPKVTLIYSEVKPSGYISMPIAKIKYQNSNYKMMDYIPPYISCNNKLSIYKEYKAILLEIKQKVIYLTKRINQSTEGSGKIIKHYTKIKQILVGQYLLLNHIFQLKNIQPHIMFEKLINLMSNLSFLDKDTYFFDIDYNHSDILNSFKIVIEKVKKMLELIKEEYKEVIAIKNGDNFLFYIDNTFKELIIEFKFKEKDSREVMLRWVKNAIIASRSKLQLAHDNRVLGVGREIINRSELMNITSSINGILCSIDIGSQYLMLDEDLIISNPSKMDIIPQEIIFYKPVE